MNLLKGKNTVHIYEGNVYLSVEEELLRTQTFEKGSGYICIKRQFGSGSGDAAKKFIRPNAGNCIQAKDPK